MRDSASQRIQTDTTYSAREAIKRFLATAHEYSPEFVTYLVQHAAPSLLRELQTMAVLPINDAVASFARMMTPSTIETPIPNTSKLVKTVIGFLRHRLMDIIEWLSSRSRRGTGAF